MASNNNNNNNNNDSNSVIIKEVNRQLFGLWKPTQVVKSALAIKQDQEIKNNPFLRFCNGALNTMISILAPGNDGDFLDDIHAGRQTEAYNSEFLFDNRGRLNIVTGNGFRLTGGVRKSYSPRFPKAPDDRIEFRLNAPRGAKEYYYLCYKQDRNVFELYHWKLARHDLVMTFQAAAAATNVVDDRHSVLICTLPDETTITYEKLVV